MQNPLQPDPSNYNEQLKLKQQAVLNLLSVFSPPSLEVFPSPPLYYRQRVEFKIWHDQGKASYAMFPKGQKNQPYLMENFPIACKPINNLMPELMSHVNQLPVLKNKLFQIEFLCTLSGEILVTLIYHRALDQEWEEIARLTEKKFNIFILGRSRKQKIVLSQDFVKECFSLSEPEHREFLYKQPEGCFTQPNAKVCQHMLNWTSKIAKGIGEKESEDRSSDLLELYCGNGNFTLPLSRYFHKVLATEISKPLTKVAIENCDINKIENIQFVRLSAEEVTQALNKERKFRRLQDIDLDLFDFSTVFVDPPRAGLDEATNKLVKTFENIIYISCNPKTLADNLGLLSQTHKIERLALFDQFPFTEHMECGVLLSKR